MKNYTLIAFLSEGLSHKDCWGDRVTEPPEQHIFYSTNSEYISKKWGHLMHTNKDYSITLLMNGKDALDDNEDDYQEYLLMENEAEKEEAKLNKEAAIQFEIEKQAYQKQEELQKLRVQIADEEREKTELKRLQAKYEK